LVKGDRFLDLGCGPGDYSLQASSAVGETGVVYALDREGEMVDVLKKKTASWGIENIEAMVADVLQPLPLDDGSIDVCLVSTVLHALSPGEDSLDLFEEIHRVLKPSGRLAVVECKKEDASFGPPIHMRLSPEQVERCAARSGFKKTGLIDLGYNYMIQFVVA
jgi:ubiquinone/menaquinone biosynthesis C-methylase UbiE